MKINFWIILGIILGIGLIVFGGIGLNGFELTNSNPRDTLVFMGNVLAIIVGVFGTVFHLREALK